MHMYAKCDKIYHVVQELLLFSQHVTANRRTKGPTHIVIIVQTQGRCNNSTTVMLMRSTDCISLKLPADYNAVTY